jgi:hypothetical protein
MWQKPRVWSQRYAGWEPGLHAADIYPTKRTFTLTALIDSVAQDAQLDRRPLKPVKRATGVKA